ncbi:unnamed protein product [Durusdinium trenchii]|uniref:Cyclic nucleotide-binding domain-containing protein n=1 Tax=Durusdinium trenchii TaxID=1381693 RepID=A0ABP0K0V6_9DINO
MEPELRFKGLPRHDKDHLGEGRCIASASALWADDARRTAFVPEELLQRWALASRREWMCIVLSGHLEKSILRDPSLPEIPIGDVAPGGISGDMGMLGVSKVRSHSCRCVEQSSLLLLSRTAFAHLVEATGGLEEHPLLKQLEKMQNLTGEVSGPQATGCHWLPLPLVARLEIQTERDACRIDLCRRH